MLAVAHASGVVEVLTRAETDEAVVRLGILFVEEVDVVGSDDLHTMLLPQLEEDSIDLLLLFIGLLVTERVVGLMALQLEVEVIAEEPLEPLDALLRLVDIAVHDVLGDLPTEAGRGGNDALMVRLQQLLVDTWAVVVAVDPRARDHLDEVLVARDILRQED